MLLNGKELELDVFEANTAAKLETELKKVQAACVPPKEGQDASDIIRSQCVAIFELLDSLFGDGTSHALFGDKVSLTKALDVFDTLIAEINCQKAEMTVRTEKYTNISKTK